jgi:cytidylate kinase
MNASDAGSSPFAPDAVIVTIDGPAGTGKSTVAHQLATRLGLEFLDTGAMYRAAALVALESGLDPADGPALAARLAEADLHFDWSADPPRIMLGQRDVSADIRDLTVSGIVSIVAAQPTVRQELVRLQRLIASKHPRLITEGRDQGSVVFPDAGVRFFLDASMEERARRRVHQLNRAGQSVDERQIRQDIASRDRLDSSRDEAPLVRPEGAIVVDTSTLTQDEVVDTLERHVRAALPTGDFAP